MSRSLNQAIAAPFDLQPSKQLLLLFIALAFATSLCIVLCAIHLVVKAILLLFTIAAFIHTIRKHALRHAPNSVINLRQIDKRIWLLTFYNGEQKEAILSGQSLVNANSALLLFNRMPHQTLASWLHYSVLISSDTLASPQLRSLKARMLAIQFT